MSGLGNWYESDGYFKKGDNYLYAYKVYTCHSMFESHHLD